MEPLFQFDLPKDQSSIIKVFGVGGGGSNAVNHMYDQGIVGVNFVVLNTDSQALDMSRTPNKIQLGPELTQGLGAGANPVVGANSAEESVADIKELLSKNTKMVFITAGMGGGTGTGAAPVVARIAREMGILTVGIVTTPFWFEGKARYNHALEGINKLRENVDTLLTINNDKIREMYGNLTRKEAFGHANNILTTAAKAISEIITVPGEINVDFADVQTVMKNGGSAIMGCATAEGEQRAILAAQGALNSPLLNDNNISGAKKVLVNITTGTLQVTMDEIGEIMEYVQQAAGSTDIILGACDDPSLGDKLSVTIIATGFEVGRKAEPYKEQKVVKVYELNDKPEEKKEEKQLLNPSPVLSTPAVEEVATPVVENNAKEVPVIPIIVAPQTGLRPAAELIDLEEPFSLFTQNEETEAKDDVTFEFELTREEQLLSENPVLEENNGLLEEETNLTVDSELLVEPTLTQEEVKLEDQGELLETPIVETKEEEFLTYTRRDVEPELPVTNDYNQQLEDRKKVLAGLSYRFGVKQNLNEFETEPAYKRKGLELNSDQQYSTQSPEVSRYSVGKDAFERPEIKKNNQFLHDNVD